MKKYTVNVPPGLKFMSDWKGYEIPQGKCIIDKKVCGCGYTQLCLTNTDNIILCSPRVALLENKAEQNSNCLYLDSKKITKKEQLRFGLTTDKEISEFILNFQKQKVFDYLQLCKAEGRPNKFMVTYDSLPKLLEILVFLGVDLNYFKVIVDEFQLIFSDARFKADVELDFVKYLELYCKNVCFLSSTPMLKEYLELMSEFKDLDYYEFNWDMSKVGIPNIVRIKSYNLEQSLLEIIGLYKEGKGPIKKVDGIEYKSTEAVFYVSNVSMITSVIKKSGLKSSDVNIICSKSADNLRKIKRCGKEFTYGTIPTKGKPHKMFTFCTSTAFCGVDFYSTCAKSYVFSNCNLDTMSIDIGIELPQIIGRQRLPENVFRFDISFYYQTCIKEFSKEDFERKMEDKKQRTDIKITNFNIVLNSISGDINDQRELIRAWIKQDKYSKDFCSIDRITGLPIYNNLVYLSDLRAWELQNKIYEDDLSVLKILENIGEISTENQNFLDEIVSYPYFEDRMEAIVKHIEENPEDIDKIPDKYISYIKEIPLENLKTGSLRKGDLDKKIKNHLGENKKLEEEIISEVYNNFFEGKVYTRTEIKSTLSVIYGGNISSKATDIELYFDIVRSRITNKATRKREEGYKLIKRKY